MSNNNYDWSFQAFLEACAEVGMSSTAKSMQRQKQAKKIVKHIKKQNRRKKSLNGSINYGSSF